MQVKQIIDLQSGILKSGIGLKQDFQNS